jgi:Na+/melibiose symporter-like transporter
MTENNNNESEDLKEQEEYRNLVLELYKENQKFLNNLILGISSLAFPFLYNVLSNEKLEKTTQFLLIIALFGFCIVILFQIIAIKNAREGCDNSLSEDDEKKKRTTKLFEKAKKFDKYRDYCFLLSMFLTAIAITYKPLLHFLTKTYC